MLAPEWKQMTTHELSRSAFPDQEIREQSQSPGIIKRKIDWTVHLTRRSYPNILYRSGMKVKVLQEMTCH
jgi:hypothetical protein